MEENRKGASTRVIGNRNNGNILRASLCTQEVFWGIELWEGGDKNYRRGFTKDTY